MSTEEEIIRKIRYYQEKLDRYALNKNHKKIITVLGQLKELPIRTVHLEQTGIGRTVNALKKLGDDVSEVSKSIVTFWKEMVKQEEEELQDTPDHDSPEQYQSDEPTNEEDFDDREHEQNNSTEPETEENHNGYESDEYHSDEEYPKSKTYDSDKSDRDHHLEKKYKHKHESNKHKHESHDSSDRKNKNSGGTSDHRDKHSDGHSHKSRDRDNSKRSDRESKKHSDGKSHLKESVVNNDKRSKHYDKKTEHLENTNRNEEQKIDKRHNSNKDHRSNKDRNADKERSSNKERSSDKHSSEKHQSADKHYGADRNRTSHKHRSPEKYQTSEKHNSSEKQNNSNKKNNHSDKADRNSSSGKHTSDGLNKNSDKETKSKDKDLKRKHEKEPESSSSKKLKGESFKEPSKEKKSNRSEKKSSSKSKSSKPYGSESGIDSGSGASFAEALGMCSGPSSSKASTSSKKKTHVEKIPETNAIKMEKDSPELEIDANVPVALKRPQLEPLQINIASLLPEITPNYKPLGLPIDMHPASRRISLTDEEALSRAMMNKNQRTKVYSGNKTFGKVESLFHLCVRVLQDNIDALEYTGGVPFSILKPVLQRATPDQLFNLEHHNPYLIEDTDDMWKRHCEKDFRTKKREEMESWREMYMRCLQEREARLNAITANIKQSQDKSIPVRTTKLAYVDSVVKPPRNIARKQAKNGTANAVTPSERLQQISKASEAVKVSVPSAGSRANDRPSTSSQQNKPKKAPLMAKALQSFKKIRR